LPFAHKERERNYSVHKKGYIQNGTIKGGNIMKILVVQPGDVERELMQ
jgi:hypothetical protein